MTIPVRSIDDFFDNEYLGYAKYVVENRAIPSVIDGFKPSQRKIAYAAHKLWKTGKEKPLKVFQLGGQAAAISFFHHGSLDGTIIGMAQDFKNSMPIFHGIGQFGSLRSPEAGAPRYIGVKFNENFRLLYKDFELVTPQYEEGEEIEPHFFLPIIPTVLLNGGSGIAVGFATNILNRNPLDLIDSCLAELNGKKIKPLKPWIKGFKGTFEQAPDNPKSWLIHGNVIVHNTTKVEITEIPPSFTYEKYETHLENLIEKSIMNGYDDNTSEQVNYVLKFTRASLAKLNKRNALEKTLKLTERQGENFTTLDENGNLKIFESSEEIVKYFVDFRLRYYEKRKDLLLENIKKELVTLTNRARFIKMIIDEKLKISMRKKADIENDLEQYSFDKVNDSYSYLISMPIHSLTKEKYEELLNQVSNKNKEKETIENTTPIEMYKFDLKELRKKIVKLKIY